MNHKNCKIHYARETSFAGEIAQGLTHKMIIDMMETIEKESGGTPDIIPYVPWQCETCKVWYESFFRHRKCLGCAQ